MLEILQHKIDFWLKDENGVLIKNDHLDEYSKEHIKDMIMQGYNQGELCQYNHLLKCEYRGGWEIVTS